MNKTIGIIFILVIICLVLGLRAFLIFAPPATDESIYAYNAWLIYTNPTPGFLLPDVGSLNLYPALFSWVFALDLNALFLLRCLDALIMAATAVALYQVLKQLSGSRPLVMVLMIVSVITINDPVFVQYGFKNSIFVAYLFFLMAILIGLKGQKAASDWYLIGALIALSVLLREPFVGHAIAGVVAVYFCGGWLAARKYVIGGGLAGGSVILGIALLRSGWHRMLSSYQDAGALYAKLDDYRDWLLTESAVTFLVNAIAIVVPAILALIFLLFRARQNPPLLKPIIFWLAVALIPMIEPVLKVGYPYHYASSIIGMSGLIALAIGQGLSSIRVIRWLVYLLITFSVSVTLVKLNKFTSIFKQYAPSPWQQIIHSWPKQHIASSHYLLIANELKSLAGSSASPHTLSVSGTLLGLFPLSKLTPSSPSLAHLSYAFIHQKMDTNKLKANILACPAKFIVITESSPFEDALPLLKMLKTIPQYQLKKIIPADQSKHYGRLDASIYQWSGQLPICQAGLTNP